MSKTAETTEVAFALRQMNSEMMLKDLMARYHQAQKSWEALYDQDSDKAGTSPEWDDYMDLSDEIIGFTCDDPAVLKTKAELLLSDVQLFDTLKNSDSDRPLRKFLASICGGLSVLDMVIANYTKAHDAWIASGDKGEDLKIEDCREYDLFTIAEMDLINFPCRASEEVQKKIRFVVSRPELAQSISSGGSDVTFNNRFLGSLIMPVPPVDIGEDVPNEQP